MKYTNFIFYVLVICGFYAGCEAKKTVSGRDGNPVFDTQAHRGGRGLMPENTIPAMLDAIDRGVSTLELDLQVSGDKKVLVSHDPYFNEKITTAPDRKLLTKEDAGKLRLYGMTYDSIAGYDVGLKSNPDFPRQKSVAAVKPLLSELIRAAEEYARKRHRTIRYNMEIKSTVAGENVCHPPVEEYAGLVMKVITEEKVAGRTTIQSFDVRALRIIHEKYPSVNTSYLVNYREKRPVRELIDTLGFIPDVYSPDYRHVTPELVEYCHSKNIRVIPWTVNDRTVLQKMICLRVDGVISDYPDLFEEAGLTDK